MEAKTKQIGIGTAVGLGVGLLVGNQAPRITPPTPHLVQGQILTASGAPAREIPVQVYAGGQWLAQVRTDGEGRYAVTFQEPLVELRPQLAGTQFPPTYVSESTQLNLRGVAEP